MTTVTTKLQKKTLDLIEQVNIIIKENPVEHITLRQIWYRIVSKKILEQNPSNYKKVSQAVVKGRKQGLISKEKIIDKHRKKFLEEYYYEKPKDFYKRKTSYKALKQYLTSYYVHRWKNQPNYLEIWTEKEALSTLLEPISREKDVSLIICKGYASYTIILEGAKRIKEECKKRKIDKVILLYYGDYDPSGKMISKAIQKELKILGTSFLFVNIALTSAQINQYNLSMIPLNKKDKNYAWFIKNYGNMGCELDALEPLVFQNVVNESIQKYFDEAIFKEVEAQRKEAIDKMVLEAEKLLSKMDVK